MLLAQGQPMGGFLTSHEMRMRGVPNRGLARAVPMGMEFAKKVRPD
jgi:hypothetical protein